MKEVKGTQGNLDRRRAEEGRRNEKEGRKGDNVFRRFSPTLIRLIYFREMFDNFRIHFFFFDYSCSGWVLSTILCPSEASSLAEPGGGKDLAGSESLPVVGQTKPVFQLPG